MIGLVAGRWLTRFLVTKTDAGQKVAWKATSLATGFAVALLVRTVLQKGWTAATGREPPTNPADPSTDLADALLWSTAVGAGVGAARMANRRALAEVFESATGDLPPGLRGDDDA